MMKIQILISIRRIFISSSFFLSYLLGANLLGFYVPLQAQNEIAFHYARALNRIGSAYRSLGGDMTIDSEGNLLLTGSSDNNPKIVDFDPGPDKFELSGSFAFFAKYDSFGKLAWVKNIKGDIYSTDISLDKEGNIYLAGYFYGSVDFDTGSGVFELTSPNAVFSAVFFAKYNPTGGLIWAKAINVPVYTYLTRISIVPDLQGYVYILGDFYETADFDPNEGTFNLTSNYPDIFLAKYNPSGNLIWVQQFGSADGYDFGTSLVLDNKGSVYIAGYFNGIVDFDPGTGTTNLNSENGGGCFFGKYDTNGKLTWVKNVDYGGFYDWPTLAVDASGNVFIAGTILNTNNYNISFGKYDANGNLLWKNKIIGSEDDQTGSMVLDANGNIYLTGMFSSTNIDFDPGPGILLLSSSSSYSIFFAKYNNNGGVIWAKELLGIYAFGHSIELDTSGNIYLLGGFELSTDFDPNMGKYNLSGNQTDLFFAKYGAPAEINVKQNNTILDSGSGIYDFGSVNLNSSSTEISFNIENPDASNPLYLLNLPSVMIEGNHAADFVIKTQPSNTISAGKNSSFIVQFIPKTAGERMATLIIPNNDINENPYSFQLKGTAVKLNQTISFTCPPANIPYNYQNNQLILNATASSGLPVTYSITTNPESGVATLSNNIITFQSLGSVRLDVYQTGSKDYESTSTLVCKFNVSLPTEIEEDRLNKATQIYPNPNNRFLTIEIDLPDMQNVDFRLTNTVGKSLDYKKVSGSTSGIQTTFDISLLPAGLYLLEINYRNRKLIKKVIKL